MERKVKTGPKIIGLALLVIALIFGGKWVLNNTNLVPKGPGGQGASFFKHAKEPLKVCVVTWGGYAGGQYYNRGFKPNDDSEYLKKYNLPVEFVVIDDYNASREAWKSDAVQVLWTTADSFPTEAGSLQKAGYKPRVIFQSDWSRGGDVIVSTRAINSVQDLRGKKVSVAFGTPSHTFLLRSLEAAGMSTKDINVVEVPSAIDSATAFKAGQVDAAVVWSPDDEDCVSTVPGAKALASTKQATHIIADVFYVKEEMLEKRRDDIKALVEGWMAGAAAVNSDSTARAKAVKILAEGLNQPEDFIDRAIGNVRLTTYGDNVNFFNLRGGFSGVTGEQLYIETGRLYQENTNLVPPNMPSWRTVSDPSILRDISLTGPNDGAESEFKFSQPTKSLETAPALSTKRLSVSFTTGSATLDANAKTIIDLGFVPTAKSFASARIRIEGNTDSTGSASTNERLSYLRAKAVAQYLTDQYGFDSNRFVIVGNGPNKPVADNDTEEGRTANRRTDFELVR